MAKREKEKAPDVFTVLQMHWGSVPFADDVIAINAAYCARHGYNHVVQVIDTPEEAEETFARRLYQKIPLAIAELENADHVIYLDLDAYFVDHDKKLEEILATYFQDEVTAVLFAENAFDKWRRASEGGVNAGVFLAREHEMTRPILEAWDTSYDTAVRVLVPENANEHEEYLGSMDQTAFNHFVLPKFSANINIARVPDFGGIDGTFIAHQMLIHDEVRADRIAADRIRLVG